MAGGAARRDRAIKRAEKTPRHVDTLGGLGGRAERSAAARHHRLGAERAQAVERRRPIREMGVAAIAGRAVFDEIPREHDAGARHPRPPPPPPRRMGRAEMHDPTLTLAEPHRHALRKGDARPSEAGNRRGGAEEPGEPADLGIHVLPAAPHDHLAGDIGAENFGALVARGAQHPHRVVMREQHVFDRLVGDLAHALDHLLCHCGSGLRVDHHDGVVAHDDAGIGVAFGRIGIEAAAHLVEGHGLFGGVGGRRKALGHVPPWRTGNSEWRRGMSAGRMGQPSIPGLFLATCTSATGCAGGQVPSSSRRPPAGMAPTGPRCRRATVDEAATDREQAPAQTSGETAPLKLEEFLPYRLNVLANLVSQALSRIYVERYGLGVPEWRVLVTLGQFGVMTGKAIGAHSHMHKTKVSRAVDELEKRKLIGRRANRADLRESFLSLSAAGRAIYEDLAPGALEFTRRLAEVIDPADRPAFERAMQRLTERSRTLAAEAAKAGANSE